MIDIQNLSFEIAGKTILDSIDVAFEKSSLNAIIGPSGAGKSTLLNLLMGLYKPSKGEILVNEIKLSSLKKNSRQKYRQNIGMVWQDFRLLPKKTVFENVKFALEVINFPRLEMEKAVLTALEKVGLSHQINAYPRELSGGEKQRCALARAIVHNPSILICDEPTGNLDLKNAREVIELLYKVNKNNTTVIIVTHNVDLLEGFNGQIYLLENSNLKLI
ncbi:cell division ATP-binding protein FtsE [bacterium]|nr:cell division ATP-binding protein FtsE [bacterium]|tara:strand:- start:152 stop:805 length:654 start_codon:yes stop_codon:yes gene_type:complete